MSLLRVCILRARSGHRPEELLTDPHRIRRMSKSGAVPATAAATGS